MAQSETSDAPLQRPVHVIDHFPVRASIWRNIADNGVVWYSATVTKRFALRNHEADRQREYGTTHSLSFDDLLPAALALETAYAWIQANRTRDQKASSRDASSSG